MDGTVTKIVKDKNFGFIRGTDGKDYFFHRQHIHGFWEEYKEGTKVNFESVKSDKGPRAENVIVVPEGY